MMSKIELAAVDMAADMVMAFHVNKQKEWSPDYIFDNNMEYWIHEFEELYLMAQMLFPIMLVRFVSGQPLMEAE
jgi:hypothetical protein